MQCLRGGDEGAVGPQYFGEDVLSPLRPGATEADVVGAGALKLAGDVIDPGPQAVVERAAQIGCDPQVDEDADEDQDRGHGERERGRQPQADRQGTQDGGCPRRR